MSPMIKIRLTGCVRIATAIPTSEPNVPGALGMYPTPKAVAIASASRGFWGGVWGAAVASVFGVIRVVQVIVQIRDNGVPLACSNVIFIENWFGDHVFLAGPVTQIPFPAALAAKREVRVDRTVSRCFADGALVLHGVVLFFSANAVVRLLVPTLSRGPGVSSFSTKRKENTQAKETLSLKEEYNSPPSSHHNKELDSRRHARRGHAGKNRRSSPISLRSG